MLSLLTESIEQVGTDTEGKGKLSHGPFNMPGYYRG